MRLTFGFSWAKIILKHTLLCTFRKKRLERSSCASSASRSYANSSSTESLYPNPMIESPASSPKHAGHVGILPFQQAKNLTCRFQITRLLSFYIKRTKKSKLCIVK